MLFLLLFSIKYYKKKYENLVKNIGLIRYKKSPSKLIIRKFILLENVLGIYFIIHMIIIIRKLDNNKKYNFYTVLLYFFMRFI